MTGLSNFAADASRYKNLFLVLFCLMVMLPIFSLNYKDIRFRDDNLILVNQLSGHHGLLEMYVHLYAGMFLFIASIVSVYVLYGQFKGSTFTWRPVMAGIFVAGMIGFSESIDHLFAVYSSSGLIALAGHNFFHFMHVLGGPIAIFFFYQGTKEYSMQFREGGSPMSKPAIITLLSVLPLLSLVTTILTLKVFEIDIAGTTLFIVSIAALVLAGFTLLESYRQWEMQSFLVGYLSLLAVSVTLLFITILLSLNSALLGNAYLYALSYSLQDIFHAVTASLIVLFTISMNVMLNEP